MTGPASQSPAGAERTLGGPLCASALVVAMFIEAVGYGMVVPTLPFLARRFGAGETEIGLLVGLYAVAGLIASLPLAAFSDRYGRRTLILIGLGLVILAAAGFVFAPSYGWLLVARIVQGLGASAIWIGSLTLAGELSHDDAMGRSMSWMTGAWAAGFVVGPAIGGLGSDLAVPFLLYGFLSVAGLILGWVALPSTRVSAERIRLANLIDVLGNRAVRQSATATFAASFFFAAVESFLPLMAADAGVTRTQIGLLFALAGLPPVLLPRLVGTFADRLGDVPVLMGGLVYTALLAALFLPAFDNLPYPILFLLVGLVDVAVFVPAIALLNRGREERERSFATAVHSYAFSGGFFVGPLAGGAVAEAHGEGALFQLLTVVLLLAIAIVALLSRRHKTP